MCRIGSALRQGGGPCSAPLAVLAGDFPSCGWSTRIKFAISIPRPDRAARLRWRGRGSCSLEGGFDFAIRRIPWTARAGQLGACARACSARGSSLRAGPPARWKEPQSLEQLSSIDRRDRSGSNTRGAEPRDRATPCRPWRSDDRIRAAASHQARSRRERAELDYAAYELDQLRETFADLAQILPKYRDLSIPDLITSTVEEPLAALDRAIQAKDANQFPAAYGQLTASCNACHKSYDRTAIVIQPPTVAATFPDQDFRPPTK
jgi:hypothetical protein